MKLIVPQKKTLREQLDWDNEVEKYEVEISKQLAKLGIDEKTVTTVPLDLPFFPSTVVTPEQFILLLEPTAAPMTVPESNVASVTVPEQTVAPITVSGLAEVPVMA